MKTTLDPAHIDPLLETLTGVVRARVRVDEDRDALTEIHLLSDGAVAPKQIVRNVETLLETAFDLTIDHRIVSIAVLKEGADLDDLQVNGSGDQAGGPAGSASTGSDRTDAVAPPRVVFRRLRIVQESPLKCTAYVELEVGDVIFEGSHRDTDTPRGRTYSAARAVIEALEYLAQKEMAFYLAGLECLNVLQNEVLVALVEGRRDFKQTRMLGTARVEGDPPEAAVRAVLDAVNRFITRPGGVTATSLE